jgi:hypothetical protein
MRFFHGLIVMASEAMGALALLALWGHYEGFFDGRDRFYMEGAYTLSVWVPPVVVCWGALGIALFATFFASALRRILG